MYRANLRCGRTKNTGRKQGKCGLDYQTAEEVANLHKEVNEAQEARAAPKVG